MNALKLSFILAFVLFGTALFAAPNSGGRVGTAISARNGQTSFVGLNYKQTRIMGKAASLAGIEGGITTKGRWSFGIEGYGLTDKMSLDENNSVDISLGGPFVAYTMPTRTSYEFEFSTSLNWGSVTVLPTGKPLGLLPQSQVTRDQFTSIEPQVALRKDVLPRFDVALVGGYRIVHGVDNERLNYKEFNGWTASLTAVYHFPK